MYDLIFGWSCVEPGVGLDDHPFVGPFQLGIFYDDSMNILVSGRF